MKKSIQWIVIAVGVIGLAVAIFCFRDREERLSKNPPPKPSVTEKSTPSELAQSAPQTVAADPLLDALGSALGTKETAKIRQAANAVRQKAIHDPDYLRSLGATIADVGRTMEVREVVALVLGTIQNPEAGKLLVASLGKVSDPGLLRCIVNAIGSWKEPDDHDSFSGLDNPSVVEHASGLQIMVKTKITDAAAADALLELMKSTGDAELRADVARALRISLDLDPVRAAFLEAVQHGYDLKTTAQLG
jgi:HEAT repeat protein